MIQLRGPLTLPDPVRLEAPGMQAPSWLEINVGALERNFTAIRRLLAAHAVPSHDDPRPRDRRRQPMIAAVVKKDAYGLGAVTVAHRLVKQGCEMLAVYSADEANELVSKAVTNPILMFMPIRTLSRTDVLYRHAVAERLHLAIHDEDQLIKVNEIGQTFGIRLPIHFALDTGMSRAQLSPERFGELMGRLDQYRHVRVAGIYSHLATSDSDADFAYEQLERFEAAVAEQAGKLTDPFVLHIANTCGVFRDARYHLDMVRPGLGLYGYGPERIEGPMLDDAPTLEHTVRWVSKVIHVQRKPRRSPVGYGCTHKLKRESVLGVVPVGYGDGYPVALSNKATVRVHPRDPMQPTVDCKVLGRVNMDQIVIDLTDLVGESEMEAARGLAVEVISPDPAAPNSLPALAAICKTHVYELLTRLSERLPRKYVG